MKASTFSHLTRQARRIYAHRLAADPDSCPVCCGDGSTDDRRFGGEVLYTINKVHNVYPIFRCFCCQEEDAS